MKAQLDAVRLENHHLKEASFQGELRVKMSYMLIQQN